MSSARLRGRACQHTSTTIGVKAIGPSQGRGGAGSITRRAAEREPGVHLLPLGVVGHSLAQAFHRRPRHHHAVVGAEAGGGNHHLPRGGFSLVAQGLPWSTKGQKGVNGSRQRQRGVKKHTVTVVHAVIQQLAVSGAATF